MDCSTVVPTRRSGIRWLVWATLLLTSSVAVAQTSQPPGEVQLGIDGVVKRGCWAQLPATVNADKAVRSFDGEGFPLTTSSTGDLPLVRHVKLGRRIEQLAFEPSSSDDSTASRYPVVTTRVVSSLQELVIVIGGDITFEAAIRLRRRPEAQLIVGHSVERIASLPQHRLGYDGVTALILCTSDMSVVDSISEPQWQAIQTWVEQGGCLLVSVGVNAEPLMSGPLSQLLPGNFQRTFRQRQTTGLESFTKAGKPISLRDEVGRIVGIPTLVLDDVRGEVLLEEGSGEEKTQWLIRSSHGLGTVLWVMADLDAEPLAGWPDRARFVAKLLDIVIPGSSELEERRGGQVRHLGFTDVAGQLRVALDQFPNVALVPFSLIAGLLALYILLIGPIDYFVLRQFDGRMQWTWVTFPLLVVTFGAIAGVLVQRLKSDQIQTNQVDLMDVDARRGVVRCTSWAHIYSPRPVYYAFDIQPADAWQVGDPSALVTWDGLPGAGFSGLEGQGAQPPLVEPYHNRLVFQSDRLRGTLEHVGLPAHSTRSLIGCWSGQLPVTTDAELTLDENGLLRGQLANPLPVALRDAAIACNGWYYKIGTFASGTSFSMKSVPRKQNLSYRLTRRSVDQSGDRDYNDITTPWKQTSDDIGRIMEMIMFHEAAGGRDYTGLIHRFQGHLDMSDQLNMQTAILFGRLDDAASELAVTTDDPGAQTKKTWAFARVLLPVSKN